MNTNLKIQLYQDRNATLVVDELTGRWEALSFSSALHGGFKDCRILVNTTLPLAWSYLKREGAHGHHFRHLTIQDQLGTVWEGRLTDIGFNVTPAGVGLDLTAFGYWSSMRDQYYDASDAGRTDWTVGGPRKVSEVIRELITTECPQIVGTTDIDTTTLDIVGINLTGKNYPMDIIVDKLAPLSDSDNSIWYFGVWEKRRPYWKKRTLNIIEWFVYMKDIENLSLNQQGKHLRNSVASIIGTAVGAFAIDADSTAIYPTREILINLPTGVSVAAGTTAATAALNERKNPVQDQSFTIKGSTWAAGPGAYPGRVGSIEERPKWWIRAGQTIRIQDLVPVGAVGGTLDNVRTFYILETRYDAKRDALDVQPDRPRTALGNLLSRISQLEPKR